MASWPLRSSSPSATPSWTRPKLKRTSASEFAQTVIEATRWFSEDYVKEVNQGELVDWAIRGLYRSLDEKMPPTTSMTGSTRSRT